MRIVILLDWVAPIFQSRPPLVVPLLAHVLAHEIGHVLQGINRHSETGLMRERWTDDDYQQMLVGTLPFEPVDVNLIRLGMESHRPSTCPVQDPRGITRHPLSANPRGRSTPPEQPAQNGVRALPEFTGNSPPA